MVIETNKKLINLHTDVHRIENFSHVASGFLITSMLGLTTFIVQTILKYL